MRLQCSLSVVALSALVSLFSSGCFALLVGTVAAGAAAGTVLYVNGALEGTVEAGTEATVEAAVGALEELEIPVLSSSATSVDGRVTARTATDTKVAITVTREAAGLSRVAIRVGTFGDRSMSQAIWDAMRKRLPD